MKHIKIITLALSLVVISALTFVGIASAQSIKSGDNVTVGQNEVVNSMLFAGGNNINIAGTVNGDVYCAGRTVTISGTVNGDVICAGQTMVVNGKIDGNARLVGSSITLSNSISGSATIGGQTVLLDKNAKVGRDLLGGATTLTIDGNVGRDMLAGSANIIINGNIGRNVKSETRDLTIGSTGYVGGNVDYTSKNDLTITSGGTVLGSTTKTLPKENTTAKVYAPMAFTFGFFVFGFIAMLVTALILVALFPRIFAEATATAMKKPGTTILTGLVAAIVIPILVFMLFISIIGIPLAIMTLLAWIILMMISGPFVAYLLGKLLLKNAKQPVGIMALGASVLIISYFIPIIGFFTMVAAYLFGLGMVLNRARWMTLRGTTKKATK
jgi:hypothetical protein